MSTQAIEYPQLPPHLQQLADQIPSVPDYSDETAIPEELRDLDDLPEQWDKMTQDINGTQIDKKYDDLSWNAASKKRLLMDYDFVHDATMRRAMLGFGKGFAVGGSLGGLISYYCVRRAKQRLPNSLHAYTVGGIGLVFASVKMVQDTRRYQEYIAYVQSGIANPDQLHIDGAQDHLGTVMEKTMSPETVKKIRNTPKMQRILEQQYK